MDRETESLSRAIELLESLFEMPKPRREKCETLFKLARRSSGPIVELGTFWGNGAIALSLGSRGNLVYTVDDYQDKKGWAGEAYCPSDRHVFYDMCDRADANPILVEKNVVDALEGWYTPIGLLYWDIGCDDLEGTIMGWTQHIMIGGILAIHDTMTHLFGARDFIGKLCQHGFFRDYQEMPGGVHVAVKNG